MKDNPNFIKPQASRTAPRMEQTAAVKAGVYHVIPVLDEGISYSIETIFLSAPDGMEHVLVANDLNGNQRWRSLVYQRTYEPHLETDVQQVFVVDLYVKGSEVVVKIEYREPISFNKKSGERLH